MRLSSILREAGLNLLSETARAPFFSVTLALIVGLLGCADVITVASLGREAQNFRSAGGSTFVYAMDGEIDGRACDALTDVPAIRAAGAVRREQTGLSASVLPGERIPTFTVSPGFGGFRALGSPERGADVLVSADVASALGIRQGQRLPLTGGTPAVGGIFSYADDGRQPGYGYSVLLREGMTLPAFDACWVEAWPVPAGMAGLLATTLRPGAVSGELASAPRPQLQQLNASLGQRFDGTARYGDRLTRFGPLVAAAAGFALGFGSIRRRRLELAAARHARVRRSAQVCQMLIETTAWTLAGTVFASSVFAGVIALQGTPEPGALALLAARCALAAACLAIVGSVAATILIRERVLFTLFKAR